MAWAVVQGARKRLPPKAWGFARPGSSAAVNADTVFQLASVSKSLAATVVACQVGLGRVSWDSRMKDLLPWLRCCNPGSSVVLTVICLPTAAACPTMRATSLRSWAAGQAGGAGAAAPAARQTAAQRIRLHQCRLTAAAVSVAGAANTDWAEPVTPDPVCALWA